MLRHWLDPGCLLVFSLVHLCVVSHPFINIKPADFFEISWGEHGALFIHFWREFCNTEIGCYCSFIFRMCRLVQSDKHISNVVWLMGWYQMKVDCTVFVNYSKIATPCIFMKQEAWLWWKLFENKYVWGYNETITATYK